MSCQVLCEAGAALARPYSGERYICTGSLVNQTVFHERACAIERGRGERENRVFEATTGSCRDQSDFRYALIGARRVPRKPQSMHILVWHICMQVSEVEEKSPWLAIELRDYQYLV